MTASDTQPRRGELLAVPPFDAVVTHHMNPYRSGVARFNQVMATRLRVPLSGLSGWSDSYAHPLLSFKVSELGAAEQAAIEERLDGRHSFFLHDWSDLPLEHQLVDNAVRVLCGNDAILHTVSARVPNAERAWAPGLILDHRAIAPGEISVFSFGMAHKMRTDMFRRLGALLESTGRSYALFISNANHETATERDTELVHSEIAEVFPRSLYFMGNLSDVAIYNHLTTATYFAAFFPEGVRTNNTSIASAMEHGAVVITNLDEQSPPEFVHGDNLLDIAQLDSLPSDPLVLKRISCRAMETARELSWDRLVDRLLDGT